MGRVRVSGKVFGDELYCPHLSSKREGGDYEGRRCRYPWPDRNVLSRRQEGGHSWKKGEIPELNVKTHSLLRKRRDV